MEKVHVGCLSARQFKMTKKTSTCAEEVLSGFSLMFVIIQTSNQYCNNIYTIPFQLNE
jgi:hypothetical protein